MGPYLAVLEPADFAYLDDLTPTLAVNGGVRQQLLTGTPAGCALRVPKPLVRKLMQLLLPEKMFWSAFPSGQARSSKYLQPGDFMSLSIANADRVIDLGKQRTTVIAA